MMRFAGADVGDSAMHCTIAQASDRTLWAAGMSASGANDVYYRLDYHQLYSFLGGRCVAYIARGGGETLFHPFFLRPIGRVGAVRVSPRLHDIETVYGYTGPIATTDSRDFLNEAWLGFEPWCQDNGVVAEFSRFHPILRTERFAAAQAEVRFDRETVVVRLDGDEETLWQSYSPAHRNKIRKALKLGLSCEQVDLDQGLDAFVRLYDATMQRREARDFYHFPPTYYELMRRTLGASARLFMVHHDGRTVAGGIFLLAGATVHYHLSGSRADAQRLAPSNLLLHEVALWAQRRGFKRLHLGGGRSSAPDDPLLVFKRGISRQTRPFHLGRRVHDPVEYDNLCGMWKNEYAAERLQSFFPPYRARPDQAPRQDHAASGARASGAGAMLREV